MKFNVWSVEFYTKATRCYWKRVRKIYLNEKECVQWSWAGKRKINMAIFQQTIWRLIVTPIKAQHFLFPEINKLL